MARTTPRVAAGILTLVDGSNIIVGTAEWYAWLDTSTTFAFVGEQGSFTARKERAGRGGSYWKAYRKRDGTLVRAYLGRSANLTLDRLDAAAADLALRQSDFGALEPGSDGNGTGSANRSDQAFPDLSLHPPLLATKFYIPPMRPNLVPRPRLTEQLHAGIMGKLTLISTPAGFGKTTLVSAWHATPAGRQFPLAWISLDASDNDPVQFWSYLFTALDSLHPGTGNAALFALRSPQPPPVRALLAGLLNAVAALPSDVVLVLDDYHMLDAPAIHQDVSFLLDHLPPRLHLVIVTRSDPPLPVARLRTCGALTELRAADLRFTLEEAAMFFTSVMGITLAEADLAALETRTEGWIAGLHLAALAMCDRTDLSGFISAFTGSNRFVMDYLTAEVLDRLPSTLHTFVLQTSILERMCGPLCDALFHDQAAPNQPAQPASSTPRSQELLEELERTNLFIVSLDDKRQWYRYHHLFAQVVQGRLTSSSTKEELATLHRRASTWFEQQGLNAEAVQHALTAGDWEHAMRLIEQNGSMCIVRGQIQTVLGQLNGLPDGLVRTRPWLCIFHALGLLFTNNLVAAADRLHAAEQAIQPDTPAAQICAIRGHIATIRGAIIHFSGDIAGCVALAREALELLPPTETLARPLALVIAVHDYRVSGDVTAAVEREAAAVTAPVRAAGNILAYLGAFLNLAELQVVQGRLHQARVSYADAAQVALGSGGFQLLVGSPAYYFGMADILREWNHLDAAESYLAQGMELIQGELTVHADVAVMGYTTLARVQQARGDSSSAMATIDRLLELARQRHFFELVIRRGAAEQARLALAQGNLALATRWADASGLQPDDTAVGYPHEGEYLTLARLLIAQGRSDPTGQPIRAAQALLQRLLAAAEQGNRISSVIEIRILQALALQAQVKLPAALDPLIQALTLAAPEGYTRIFLDEGAPMVELLRQAYGMLPDYTRRLLAAAGSLEINATALAPDRAFTEPLTNREREVLRLIAAGASNRDIADQLVITVGTVKRHINNLFSKLAVQSRTQAIQAARDMGLF